MFQAMEDGSVGQVGSLVNEGLSDLVIGLVIEVLGGKGCSINDGKACILMTNEMSFDQLPLVPPPFPTTRPSCR
ncbi:hypothetical protein [Ktedonobacter racemifer]|uniref:hypothetical protein n=1 Tax=Ktedonobacter racemifer TaxID=363277 RepID=UPI001FCA7BB9|nr:hypothetical protein [Ktedonobacter racemifer]